MTINANFSPATVNIHIPLRLKRRGGRKLIVTPEGHTLAPAPAQKREPDAPLVKALLKAWKWQKDLETAKQNLKIKKFLGTSENAVKAQIVAAMIAFLLLKLFHRAIPFYKEKSKTLLAVIKTNLGNRPHYRTLS